MVRLKLKGANDEDEGYGHTWPEFYVEVWFDCTDQPENRLKYRFQTKAYKIFTPDIVRHGIINVTSTRG